MDNVIRPLIRQRDPAPRECRDMPPPPRPAGLAPNSHEPRVVDVRDLPPADQRPSDFVPTVLGPGGSVQVRRDALEPAS
jgi:hypothetical protein